MSPRAASVRPTRRGFTLVELMVAIVIIIILATITVLFLPNVNEQTRAARGADQVQGWLLLAKQWALRDQSPRGLRAVEDPPGSGLVRSFVYVEQPEVLVPRVNGNVAQMSANANIVTLAAPYSQLSTQLRAGDYLQALGGPVRLITAIAAGNQGQAQPPTLLTLQSAFPNAVAATQNYRFFRQPTPMANESPLEFRDRGVIVDLSGSKLPPDSTGFRTILFHPNGSVIGTGATEHRIILYVRDENADRSQGSPTLISVNTRTGFISAHPVNFSGDPFYFTRDDRASGM